MNIRTLITPVLILIASASVISQPGQLSQEGRDRIEAQRVAFITQRLRLTPDEAMRFWPIYNEYRDALKDMRDEFERPDLETITEEEAGRIIEKHLQQETRKLELKRNLLTNLRTVISAKKVLMLHAAENGFNRELLRRVQER